MKKLINLLKKNSLYVGIISLAVGFNSCSDDDDGTVNLPDPDASISVENQAVFQNEIIVNSVTVDDEAFLVVRKVDGTTNSAIIGTSDLLSEGTHSDVAITLDNTNATDVNLEDGDNLIVIVHEDDNDNGIFDFVDGTSATDGPFMDSGGGEVSDTFTVTAPFSYNDPSIVDGNLVFDSFTTDQNVWVVVHDQNGDGTINDLDFIGSQLVPADNAESVTVTLDESFVPTSGNNLFYRVYYEDPVDGNFTYFDDDTQDIPYIFGFGDDNTITGTLVLD